MERTKPMEDNRQERMQLYRHAREMAERLIRVADRILAGETETMACMEENVNKSWIRRFVRSDISVDSGQKEKGGIRIELDDWICWQDKFLTRLAEEECYAPGDFDQVYQKCTAMACTEQEQEVLRLRFQECLALRAAGEKLGKSQERVREAENSAIRELRHP